MNLTNLVTDSYDRKARLYPALLLISPVIAVIIAGVSAKYSALQTLTAGAVACGGAFLLTQLARDAGKNLEPRLLAQWDGLPSVVIFRHRDTRFDSITKARYHRAMAALVKVAEPPTQEQEHLDPCATDEVYTAWSNYLRTHTRDQKRFALLFKENINYGYRRNVVGLRPAGIVLSIVACIFASLFAWIVYRGTGKLDQAMLGADAFSFALLILWLFRFSPGWVRAPADAYAYRLIETIDSLAVTKATPKR